jgi:trehalose 6-phosphate phosphatase
MPKPLMQSLSEVDQRIQAAGGVALFLDFDGTLAPIVEDPSGAQLFEGVRDALLRVVRRNSIVTTVISGRAVEDVYLRIRLDGVIYAGNHGHEIFGRDLRFIEPDADARRDPLRRLTEEVGSKLSHVEGVMVEDKGLTISIHFRHVAENDRPAVEEALRPCVAEAGALFRLNPGRKAFDIVPRTGWHRGAAVRWILDHLHESGMLPIYFGDDQSDEDAFAVLEDAVTVRVGSAPSTCARYRVSGPAEVYRFLLWLESRADEPRLPTPPA